jgi:hypothetical protein
MYGQQQGKPLNADLRAAAENAYIDWLRTLRGASQLAARDEDLDLIAFNERMSECKRLWELAERMENEAYLVALDEGMFDRNGHHPLE